MTRILILFVSHLIVGAMGFAFGIYTLPILTAPDAPAPGEIATMRDTAKFTGKFHRGLEGSDFFHWGEGTVHISDTEIALLGRLAPGPDYKLYLSPEFVETEDQFNKLKSKMVRVGDVKTFENFLVTVPTGIDPGKYNSVIIWCESFGEFITAAKYQ